MDKLLQLFLQYLPQLLQGTAAVQEIMDYIHKVREALKQSGEWDQATEDRFTAELQNLKDNPPPEWKPDPDDQ